MHNLYNSHFYSKHVAHFYNYQSEAVLLTRKFNNIVNLLLILTSSFPIRSWYPAVIHINNNMMYKWFI